MKVSRKTTRALGVGLVGIVAAAGLVVGRTTAPATTPTSAAAAPIVLIAAVAPASSFPTPSTTGVPNGEVLTPYTGPSTITKCGTVIDHKVISGGLVVRATNGADANYPTEAAARAAGCLILNDVRFNVGGGTDKAIDTSYPGGACGKTACGPVVAINVEVNETAAPTGIINLLVEGNLSLWRVYVHGGDQAINCAHRCDIHDSYLEASRLDTTGKAHMDAFSSNGGTNIVIDHTTLFCHVTNGASVPSGLGGGCSGDIGFFNDEAAASTNTITNNLFIGSDDPAYCAYTGAAQPGKAFKTGDHLTWANNVWQRGVTGKCATYGPVADWDPGSSNVSCNNRWETGETVIADTAGCVAPPPTTTTTVAPPTTVTPTTFLPPPPPTTTSTTPVTTSTTTAPTTTTSSSTTTTTTVPADPDLVQLRKLRAEIDAYLATRGG